jgi:hypothetical protein
MMISVEQSVEWELAGEAEVLGENLPVSLCPPQIPHDLTGARTRAAAGEPATISLSCGTAKLIVTGR